DALDLEFVIFDEAHKAKDPQAKATRAAWHLAELPTMRRRLALTATPIGNALDELWSVMRCVCPTEWPTKTAWTNRYVQQSLNRWGALEYGSFVPETQAEVLRVLDPRYRAMPKSVVLRDLPPVRG